jgi:hypothetical protein
MRRRKLESWMCVEGKLPPRTKMGMETMEIKARSSNCHSEDPSTASTAKETLACTPQGDAGTLDNAFNANSIFEIGVCALRDHVLRS